MRYAVRPMQTDDIPQVNAIDRQAFPTQWPPPPFKRDLNSKLVRYLVAAERAEEHHCSTVPVEQQARGGLNLLKYTMVRLFGGGHSPASVHVAQNTDNIVGYAAMWLMVDEAHLTSIAVDQACRRRGIAELLLISMIDLAIQLKAQVVTLETRVSNLPARALYDKYGFTTTGYRRRYYSDDGEDAIVMSTENIVSDPYQTRFQQLKQSYLERWGPMEQIPPG